MAPVGRWGKERSSLLAFGERRKSRHSPCLIERSEFEKSRRFGGRSAAESVNLQIPLCPLGQVFRHRSGCGDDGCLAGRLVRKLGFHL